MCALAFEHDEVGFRTSHLLCMMARKASTMNNSANNGIFLNQVTVAHNLTQAVNKDLHYVQTSVHFWRYCGKSGAD